MEKLYVDLRTEWTTFDDLLSALSDAGVQLLAKEAGDRYCVQASYIAHTASK